MALAWETRRVFTCMSAENFKSWRTTGPIELAPVTGFFGTNSSGKSSLLQMMLLLKQTTASADRRQVLNLGGDDRSPVSLGLIRDVLFGHDLELVMKLAFEWDPPEAIAPPDPVNPAQVLFSADRVLFQTEVAVRQDQLYVERFQYSGDVATVEMASSKAPRHRRDPEYQLTATVGGRSDFLTRVAGRPWQLPPPAKCYGFPDEVLAYFQNSEFVGSFELEIERQFGERLFYLGPLRSYPERQYTWQGSRPVDVGRAGERAIEALLASRLRGTTNARKFNSRGRAVRRITVEEHVAAWLKDLDLISSFDVQRISEEADIYRVLVRRSPDSTPVLLTDVGFGVSQILPVLVLLAYVPEGSTVLLEQPEIHLHPAVQAGLADVILEAALMRHVQVVVESHSEHLLKRLQRRVAEEKADASNIALYFCDHDGAASTIRRLTLNLLGEIDNWPKDFFGDPMGETAAMVRAALRRQVDAQA
jgi:predicted ATPase